MGEPCASQGSGDDEKTGPVPAPPASPALSPRTRLDSGDNDGDNDGDGGDVITELHDLPSTTKSGRKKKQRRPRRSRNDSEALSAMLNMTKSLPAGALAMGASASVLGSVADDGRSVASFATSATRAGVPVDPGPVGRRIESVLQFCFDASVVQVSNVSYRHHLVGLMGNRNVRLRKITQSETSKLWTAQIMTMQMDPATGTKRPRLHSLGSTFKTEKKARRAADDAAKRRDRGPPPPTAPEPGLNPATLAALGDNDSMPGTARDGMGASTRSVVSSAASTSSRSTKRTSTTARSGKSRTKRRSKSKGKGKGKGKGKSGAQTQPYLETHYQVVVVSELFENKTLAQQLTMVYRVLHEQLAVPMPEQAPIEWDSQWKSYAAVGNCVRALPEWTAYPWRIFVQCKTPAAWAAHRAAKARQRSGSIASTATAKSGKTPWGLSSKRHALKVPGGIPVVGPGSVTEAALSSDAALFLRRMDMDPGFLPAGEVQQLTDSTVPPSLVALQEAIVAAHQDLRLQRKVYKARKAAMAKAEEVWNQAGFEVDAQGRIMGFKQAPQDGDGGGGGGGNSQDGDGAVDAATATGSDKGNGKGKGKGKGGGVASASRVQASALGGHVSVAAENKAKAAQAAKAKAKAKAKKKAKASQSKSDAEKRLEKTMKAVYGNSRDTERPDAKFRKIRQRETLAAQSLQRIYRQHVVYRVLRQLRRQDRNATTISRVWRGYVARAFVAAMDAILERSALTAQRLYRGWCGRRHAREHRARVTQAAVTIQKLARGWKGRQWWKFVYLNSRAAVIVQRVVRGFVARAEARHLRRVKHFYEVVIPSAVKVQATYRRRLAIRAVARRREAVYHLRVRIPAATRIAAAWRMRAAVLERRRRARARDAATAIQRIARGMGRPAAYRAALQLHKQTLAADKIARMVRVWYSRRLLRHRADYKYRMERMIPAATFLQKFYRGACVRRVVRDMRTRMVAARTIQAAWRDSLAVREARRRWRELRQQFVFRMATRISAAFRGMKARRLAAFERHRQAAEQIGPARQLQTWWRSRAARLAFQKVLRISRIRVMRDELNEVRTDCETITEDMEDIRIDVANRLKAGKKYVKQLKALKRWRDEMRRRMPVVEKEMEDLTEEDMNAGWGEAYEQEFSYTTEALGMVAEEIAGKKLQARECDQQIESLRVELDDLETDMDHELTRELEVTERLRRTEIDMCEELWLAKERREIARQRTRWAIRGVRKAVIRRDYDARRDKAVDAEIERRGGLAALGIWDGEKDADTQMAEALAATKPTATQDESKPRSVFGLTGFRKPQGRWSTPGKKLLNSVFADPMEAPRPPPPPPHETEAQRASQERQEAAAAWAQTKQALQFIARTVHQPAGSFADDGSRDHEVPATATSGGPEVTELLPAVGLPPHLAAKHRGGNAAANYAGFVVPAPRSRSSPGGGGGGLVPSPQHQPRGVRFASGGNGGRRRSHGSVASTSSSLAGDGTRRSARERALARLRLPASAPSLSQVAHNAGGFGALSGVAQGGVGLYPEDKLGAEFAVSQPRGLMVSNTSVSIVRRLKRKQFVDKFRRDLDDKAAAEEAARVRREGGTVNPIMGNTFDAVIKDTYALLQDLTFDSRHPKDDPRARDGIM